MHDLFPRGRFPGLVLSSAWDCARALGPRRVLQGCLLAARMPLVLVELCGEYVYSNKGNAESDLPSMRIGSRVFLQDRLRRAFPAARSWAEAVAQDDPQCAARAVAYVRGC